MPENQYNEIIDKLSELKGDFREHRGYIEATLKAIDNHLSTLNSRTEKNEKSINKINQKNAMVGGGAGIGGAAILAAVWEWIKNMTP